LFHDGGPCSNKISNFLPSLVVEMLVFEFDPFFVGFGEERLLEPEVFDGLG
jgi:hypothetical protein